MHRLEIDILEGGRGTGKSTLAFKLRQKQSDTTLINFTGFHEDGDAGLIKVSHYYDSWMKFLFSMYDHDSKFVFDRFFFSEQVFHKYYKEYDFTDKYIELTDKLCDLAEEFGVKINIFFLTINDENELKERLIRDKVPFGRAEESVAETLKQQGRYENIFYLLSVYNDSDNLKIHTIDTSGKSTDDVYAEILQLKTT